MSPDAKATIRLTGLKKDYETDAGPVPVLKGLDLSIVPGEFVAIMGPSGSGKSTLMNILGCLDTPTAGEYWLDGQNVASLGEEQLSAVRSRVLGFVFQGFNLLPRIDLKANVALPLVYQGVSRSRRLERAVAVLERVGLARQVDSLPPKISGGQQQRVAIARALVTEPRVILADEPTGNLDSVTGQEIMTLFQEINRESGVTLIVVTHDARVAHYAGRLVYLRDGIVTYDGPTADFQEPMT
ncbi:MAG TPA: ABC transporter ATP-binding protein [Parasulfuritortus sp.]